MNQSKSNNQNVVQKQQQIKFLKKYQRNIDDYEQMECDIGQRKMCKSCYYEGNEPPLEQSQVQYSLSFEECQIEDVTNIKFIVSQILWFPHNLTSLSFKQCQLDNVDGIQHLRSLQFLNLQDNQISNIQNLLILQQLEKLTIFNITNNQVSTRKYYKQYIAFNIKQLKVIDHFQINSIFRMECDHLQQTGQFKHFAVSRNQMNPEMQQIINSYNQKKIFLNASQYPKSSAAYSQASYTSSKSMYNSISQQWCDYYKTKYPEFVTKTVQMFVVDNQQQVTLLKLKYTINALLSKVLIISIQHFQELSQVKQIYISNILFQIFTNTTPQFSIEEYVNNNCIINNKKRQAELIEKKHKTTNQLQFVQFDDQLMINDKQLLLYKQKLIQGVQLNEQQCTILQNLITKLLNFLQQSAVQQQ